MNNFKKIIALFLLAAAQQSFYIIEACSAGTTPTRQDYTALLETAGVSKGVITRAKRKALVRNFPWFKAQDWLEDRFPEEQLPIPNLTTLSKYLDTPYHQLTPYQAAILLTSNLSVANTPTEVRWFKAAGFSNFDPSPIPTHDDFLNAASEQLYSTELIPGMEANVSILKNDIKIIKRVHSLHLDTMIKDSLDEVFGTKIT